MKKLLFSVLFASMGFGANTAMADGWPLSVLGNWSMGIQFLSYKIITRPHLPQ
jgi:hypothetical protein